MSEVENQTQSTDSYEVPEQVLDEIDTNPQLVEQNEQFAESGQNAQPRERPNYEVVFFIRYGVNPRPSSEELTTYFSNYGDVDHINCPQDKNFAFVFMARLNTATEYRRTRTTIGQIIRDMTPETRFHITVASSNRTPSAPRQPRQDGSEHTIRYPSARYRAQRPYDQENRPPRQYNEQYDGQRERGNSTYRPELHSFVRQTENGGIRRPNNRQR